MKKPKVSVCLPTRNGHKYLEKSIKSILNQSYNNYELIISDNNSDKKTKLILKKFTKLNKIKIFNQIKILSSTENHNFLINKAKSNLIVFIHDDDLWNKDFLKNGVKKILKKKEYVAVFGKINRFKKNMNIYKSEKATKELDGDFNNRIANFLKTNFGDKLMFSIFKKNQIKNFRFSQKIFSPEIFFLYNVINSGKITFSDEMVFYKRFKFNRNVNEQNNIYGINSKTFFNFHGSFILIFLDLIKKFKFNLLLILILYRIPLFRYIFGIKLKKI